MEVARRLRILNDHGMIDAMRKRISRRSYLGTVLNTDRKNLLSAFICENSTTPSGSNIGCSILDLPGINSAEMKKLGTYGMIKGAYTFLVGHADLSARNLEDFGYFFEKILLYATHLGLGTCWIGGTLNKSVFQKKSGISEGRIIPAVSPIGTVTEHNKLPETVIRFVAQSHKRKPWSELFFLETPQTPLTEENAGEYKAVLDMVRIAPSASNKQPWRIIKEKEKSNFRFYLKRSASYQKILALMKLPDIQRIDMGIAMCHFELAAKEQGCNGHWSILHSEAPLIQNLEYSVSWIED